MDKSRYGRENNLLVDSLVSAHRIRSLSVERAFRAVDRGDFVTPDNRKQGYLQQPWRKGTLHLSAPCIYCEVLEGLALRPGLTFLNIGSGTGYFSTLVGLMIGCSGVNHGVEIHASTVDYAKKKLEQFIENSPALDEFDFCAPQFHCGNGLCFKPCQQLYDRVYCGAECPAEYLKYFKLLIKVGGILVLPFGNQLLHIKRTKVDSWSTKSLAAVAFVTLQLPTKEENANRFTLEMECPQRLQILSYAAVRKCLRESQMLRRPPVFEPLLRSPRISDVDVNELLRHVLSKDKNRVITFQFETTSDKLPNVCIKNDNLTKFSLKSTVQSNNTNGTKLFVFSGNSYNSVSSDQADTKMPCLNSKIEYDDWSEKRNSVNVTNTIKELEKIKDIWKSETKKGGLTLQDKANVSNDKGKSDNTTETNKDSETVNNVMTKIESLTETKKIVPCSDEEDKTKEQLVTKCSTPSQISQSCSPLFTLRDLFSPTGSLEVKKNSALVPRNDVPDFDSKEEKRKKALLSKSQAPSQNLLLSCPMFSLRGHTTTESLEEKKSSALILQNDRTDCDNKQERTEEALLTKCSTPSISSPRSSPLYALRDLFNPTGYLEVNSSLLTSQNDASACNNIEEKTKKALLNKSQTPSQNSQLFSYPLSGLTPAGSLKEKSTELNPNTDDPACVSKEEKTKEASISTIQASSQNSQLFSPIFPLQGLTTKSLEEEKGSALNTQNDRTTCDKRLDKSEEELLNMSSISRLSEYMKTLPPQNPFRRVEANFSSSSQKGDFKEDIQKPSNAAEDISEKESHSASGQNGNNMQLSVFMKPGSMDVHLPCQQNEYKNIVITKIDDKAIITVEDKPPRKVCTLKSSETRSENMHKLDIFTRLRITDIKSLSSAPIKKEFPPATVPISLKTLNYYTDWIWEVMQGLSTQSFNKLDTPLHKAIFQKGALLLAEAKIAYAQENALALGADLPSRTIIDHEELCDLTEMASIVPLPLAIYLECLGNTVNGDQTITPIFIEHHLNVGNTGVLSGSPRQMVPLLQRLRFGVPLRGQIHQLVLDLDFPMLNWEKIGQNLVRITEESYDFWITTRKSAPVIKWDDKEYRMFKNIVLCLNSVKGINVDFDLSHGVGSQAQLVQTTDYNVDRPIQWFTNVPVDDLSIKLGAAFAFHCPKDDKLKISDPPYMCGEVTPRRIMSTIVYPKIIS